MVKSHTCSTYPSKYKKPKKGDRVKIIIKPYNKKHHKIGIVKKVLTKKLTHTRGHKVMIMNGIIGRTVKILS
jgi:uncharacterized repeat protein (TIGR03833 family)